MKLATELHPPSRCPAEALSIAPDAPPADNGADSQQSSDSYSDIEHPLRGVRFAALKAPGRSGTRPEHLSEILGVKRKRVANRALRALGKVLDVIERGMLVEEARWITDTRSMFLEKKDGGARPIKIGEVLRVAAAKRILAKASSRLRPHLAQMRQWGIAFPRGAEGIIHWRTTVEEAARTGLIDPVVVADLDMRNFFNTVEWAAIRESVHRHFEEAIHVVEWEQRSPGTTVLPDGAAFRFNRGAEQGEPLGSVKAVLPLGEARGKVAARGAEFRGACDEWFIDDGTLICAPGLLDPWLRAFDAELARIGATRGQGDNVKSTVRLVCAPERAAEAAGWDTQYVRATCKVTSPNSPVKSLGATVGEVAAVQSSAMKVCDKISSKRRAISSLGHCAAELVLTRRCADVGNMNYWLRCYGDILTDAPAARFDKDLRAALEESVGGSIPDTAWWQAGIRVDQGGLGLRSAVDMALPAFIGSRVASMPRCSCTCWRLASRSPRCSRPSMMPASTLP